MTNTDQATRYQMTITKNGETVVTTTWASWTERQMNAYRMRWTKIGTNGNVVTITDTFTGQVKSYESRG